MSDSQAPPPPPPPPPPSAGPWGRLKKKILALGRSKKQKNGQGGLDVQVGQQEASSQRQDGSIQERENVPEDQDRRRSQRIRSRIGSFFHVGGTNNNPPPSHPPVHQSTETNAQVNDPVVPLASTGDTSGNTGDNTGGNNTGDNAGNSNPAANMGGYNSV